jgi:sialate O-acetylesterase
MRFKIWYAKLLCFGIMILPIHVNGQDSVLRLSGLFTDHMVLQQLAHVPIWGWSGPEMEVSVSTSWGVQGLVRSDTAGFWLTHLKTPIFGTGHYINVTAGDESIEISDVALGEVWLASGQSNMEMPLSGWPGNPITDSEKEIKSASNSEIRIIMIRRSMAVEPTLDVDGYWLPASENTVPDFSATAYFFAKYLYEELGIPVGIIHSSWGGTAIDSWIPIERLSTLSGNYNSLEEILNTEPVTQNTPSVLYNAMIHPLAPYSINGFLWYQGESDTGNPAGYREKFVTMIRTWREKWLMDDAPFYFVQIAPYRYDEMTRSQELREAQFKTLTEPNTGMVVTLDIGDPSDIHPANKKYVGKRLALWALARTYNRELDYSGPLFKSMQILGSTVIIHFDHAEMGLKAVNNELQHFQIAGSDRKFRPALTEIQYDRILVYHPSVPAPVAVRYMWDNYSVASLFNNAGFPASSFRTDRWD